MCTPACVACVHAYMCVFMCAPEPEKNITILVVVKVMDTSWFRLNVAKIMSCLLLKGSVWSHCFFRQGGLHAKWLTDFFFYWCVAFRSANYTNSFTTLVTFTHSHTHSTTEDRDCHARCQLAFPNQRHTLIYLWPAIHTHTDTTITGRNSVSCSRMIGDNLYKFAF